MDQTTLSVIINAVGVATGGFLFTRYKLWKLNRREIPMELQNGAWVPDGKLLRWERRAKWAAIGLFATLLLVGGWMLMAYTPPGTCLESCHR